MFMLHLFNQMSLPFRFSSIMLVQKSFKFSITAISLSIAFQDDNTIQYNIDVLYRRNHALQRGLTETSCG